MYKIDGTELYDYQQQLLQPPEEIPIWEKKCLTVEEAAASVSYTHLDVYKRQRCDNPCI